MRKDSFVDPELAEHHSDLLYAVRWLNGKPGYVYVLFEHKSYPERRIALDIAEEWVREGRQEGLREGLSEGRREEAAALVKRLLASRFGGLPEWVDARLQTASLARLEDYAVRVLDAASLEAALAD
ncbi:Rpn family recombination-promoting nuclease/putative transposase [Methylolobus aquaticus]